MKTSLLPIFLFFVLVPSALLAQDVELSRIRLSSNSTTTQIFLRFDQVPEFTEVHKGRRIDLILEANLTNTEPVPFEADDKIVKFLTQEEENATILTFFTRYDPQQVKTSTQDGKTLVVEILRGNQFTKTYPDLSARLRGVAMVAPAQQAPDNPLLNSPYAGNWELFISRYQADVLSTAPLKYTTPPFPILDFLAGSYTSDILPVEVLELASKELWKDIVPLLLDQIGTTNEEGTRKHLLLVLGETLYRMGEYDDAYTQLYLLKKKHEMESVGTAAAYLLGHLRAKIGEPHKADYLFQLLHDKINERFPLSPFILLAEIETALATNQLDRAMDLLERDDIAFPPKLSLLKDMRQSDLWFADNKPVRAFVGYQLFEEKNLLEQHPYSLNNYCNILYDQRKYQHAARCYDQLGGMVKEKEHLSSISLKKALAELHFKSFSDMIAAFSGIEDTYSNTSAGYRAALKKIDLRFTAQPAWRKTSAQFYRLLAEKAADRGVAAEAALKEAIVYNELGNHAHSIDLLMQFLRDYHASPLKQTAQALLIEQLPGQITTLFEEKRYVETIVLAKRNKELFQNNWIDIGILGMLSESYHNLGIFDEARKLYLFLLRSLPPEQQEPYYLPLLSILYAQGHYDVIEDYATQYNYNYPEGKDRDRVSLLRLQALVAAGRDDKAFTYLSSPHPETLEIEEVASRLYFKHGQYENIIDSLSPYHVKEELTSDFAKFLLAESHFQQGQKEQAEPLFLEVMDNMRFFDQSRYRLATIEQEKGNTENSLKLLREIVEKGNDELWQKLATKELEYASLANKF